MRTQLQKVVGDDNVLIVKFADIPELMNSADNFGTYRQVAEDGILLGLRRYRFFSKFFFGKCIIYLDLFSRKKTYLIAVNIFNRPLSCMHTEVRLQLSEMS